MSLKRTLLEASRIVLGLVFVISGLLKAVDPMGGAIKVGEYFGSILGSKFLWISHTFLPLSVLLCMVEFLLGAFLLMGIYRRIASRMTFVMMVFMTIVTIYISITDSVGDCGCFGDLIKLTNVQSLIKNIILLPMSYFVMRYARQMSHLYTRRERWVPAALAFIGISQFTYCNQRYLPYRDFRPYQIGFDLNKKIQEADSTYQAELLEGTRFIYRKDDRVESFTVHNLPDTTWTYERQEQSSELKNRKLTYSFEMQNSEGEAMEHLILNDQTGVLLLFSLNWNDANQDNIDEINELYRYAQEYGYKFYGVSASTPEEESEWRYQTGADYPILFMDATTIKTIIRANPGLIVMKSGVVIDKISSEMLPSIDKIPSYIHSRMKLGQGTVPSPMRLLLLGLWASILLLGLLRLLARRINARGYIIGRKNRVEKEL